MQTGTPSFTPSPHVQSPSLWVAKPINEVQFFPLQGCAHLSHVTEIAKPDAVEILGCLTS